MSDSFSFGGAGLLGGLGLLGNIISGISSYFSTRETNKFNREMYEDWKEYNTPVNQMNRLREAGINPYMVNGVSNTLSQPFQVGQTESLANLFQGVGSSFSDMSHVAAGLYNAKEQRKLTDKIQTEKLRQAWDGLKIRDRLASVAEKKGDAAAALLWKQGSIAEINKQILQRSKPYIIGSNFYKYLRDQQIYSFNELMNPMILDYYEPFKKSEINRNNASAALSRRNISHLDWSEQFQQDSFLKNWSLNHRRLSDDINYRWYKLGQDWEKFDNRLNLSQDYLNLAKSKFIWSIGSKLFDFAYGKGFRNW